MRRAVLLSVCLLLGCADSAPAKVEPEADPAALLTRLSLDLRGVRPSIAELDAVRANPAQVGGYLDAFLADPRFEARVRDLFVPIYRTRIDAYPVTAARFGLDDDQAFQISIGEEPLRILGRIAADDLPYTDLVRVDWTMANEILAEVAPLDYPSGQAGWQKAHYTDGRPAAGILSTNGLWWRYPSSAQNYNRGRANALSRILLCNDYLDRPVVFDRTSSVLGSDTLADQTRTNPACINCHSSLDPLASYLYGFWYSDTGFVSTTYSPGTESLWRSTTLAAPGYYGEPGFTLGDLGRQIAGDARFVQCAAREVYEGLLRRPATLEDTDALTAHREAFLKGGLTLRSLFRSVVADPSYRADDPARPGVVTKKMLTPELLASVVEDLTGFRWKYLGNDMLGTDTLGLRTLAGGADGASVTKQATDPNATVVLVQQRLAEAAALWAVDHDAERPESARLFAGLDWALTPETGHDAMAAEMVYLFERVLGREVDAGGQEVTTLLSLWTDVNAVERSPRRSWAAALSFLLRDPDLLLY